MKTIIAGSRTATEMDVARALSACEWVNEITEVVSGCARGADTYGERCAVAMGIPVKRMPAEWDKHGKAAGFIRNSQMARYAQALIAVWDGKSRGTRHTIEEATSWGLKVYVHRIVSA